MDNTYDCGCVNVTDPKTGLMRNVYKCIKHREFQRLAHTLREDYYEELGLIKEGKLQPNNYIKQLVEALGEIPTFKKGWALEIGCGISPYYSYLVERGYRYIGVEPSGWAASWMYRNYGATIVCKSFEEAYLTDGTYDLVLAAHCLEHMEDAPRSLRLMVSLLDTEGLLYLVVPDSSDPTNPDHLWFFTPDSLRKLCEDSGIETLALEVRKVVPQENFIYYRGRKK